MRKNRDELRRLHYINALFAHVTGRDLFLANQIKAAIAFSLSDLEEQTTADPALAETYAEAFNAAAARLLGSSIPACPATASSTGTPPARSSPARPSLPAPR